MSSEQLNFIFTKARPHVIGALLRYFKQLDIAEDAFQEACVRALKHWPGSGIPENPEGWLIWVGKNAAIDWLRKQQRNQAYLLSSENLLGENELAGSDIIDQVEHADYKNDDVLRLMFMCCHPVLTSSAQMALALNIVAGLTTNEIASAFLVRSSAMAKRINRAKQSLAEADVDFSAPDPSQRAQRVKAVSAALYLLFNEGYSASGNKAHIRGRLCKEAIRLSRLLLTLYPTEIELMGLLALMLLQHARAPARLDQHGDIVLLEHQDRGLWQQVLIKEGIALLEKALRHRRPGAYQIEAALAATHCRATTFEDTDWSEMVRLYELLELVKPSPVVQLNKAVAISKSQGARVALPLVAELRDSLSGYFYFYGVYGQLLKQVGNSAAAADALRQALALADNRAEKEFVERELAELSQGNKNR